MHFSSVENKNNKRLLLECIVLAWKKPGTKMTQTEVRMQGNFHMVYCKLYISTMDHERQTSWQTTHRIWCTQWLKSTSHTNYALEIQVMIWVINACMCSHNSCPYWQHWQTLGLLCHDINGRNMLLTQVLPTMMKHPLIFTYDYLLALHSKKGSSKTTPWNFFQ